MTLRRVPAVAFVSILCLLISIPLFAAGPRPQPQVIRPVGFAISPPVRSLPAARPDPKQPPPEAWERFNGERPLDKAEHKGDVDGALQDSAPTGGPMPPPIQNFEGMRNEDNFTAFGFRLSPPDTNGAAGPTQYVQMVNLLVRIFDKTGAPLTLPFKLSSLFAPLGGLCSTNDNGDPIVVYDGLADRWVLSQFAFTGAAPDTPPFHECIAVSTTGDATGTYYIYDFITPSDNFPDYPKLGVWPDGYYMTVHQFLAPALSFNGSGAFAFERDKMVAGDPSAQMIYVSLDLVFHPNGIFGILPSTLDGLTPPAVGTPNTFMYPIADEFADPIDGLRLYDFVVDFANPLSSTFTERPESPLALAAFDPLSTPSRADIEQPPPATSSSYVDAISGSFMFRLPARMLAGDLSHTMNLTVNVSGVAPNNPATHQAGIRWVELRRNSGTGVFSVFQQGTYAPTAPDPVNGENRWMGSVAQDNQGNMALGFSLSSLTIFPSISYAGRLTTDPAGTLGQGEASLIVGTGSQTSVASRWGDYSAMTLDPVDDCTFWYTQEYYEVSGTPADTRPWQTRVGSFKFPSCTAPAVGTLSGTITNCAGGAPIAGAIVTATGGFVRVTDASGNYSMDLPPGTYTVTVTAPGFNTVTIPGVVITDGNTTIVNACLTAVPVIQSAGATLVIESCLPANGAIDPGETVTVSFCVENVGSVDTVNLVGTLEATGGVTNPSGPQSYGVVVAGGAPVCRDFTFTADAGLACGDTLTATIDFQDGLNDLGSVTYNFTMGTQAVAFSENFDGVTAPALPAGWTSSFTNGDGDCTVGGALCALGTDWATSTTTPDTALNAAFHNDPSCVTDSLLDSPTIAIATAGAQLTFRNSYDLEASGGGFFDGGVLEISINGGAFADIITAGGSFVSGGYVGAIDLTFLSPIAGRQAWSGNSAGYITTTVNLPAAAAGANIQLRWRFASDCSISDVGWWVDTISITDGFACCASPGTVAPVALDVDLHTGTGTVSNLNSFFEPGESNVVIEPSWNNGTLAPIALTGTASNLTGPGGALYTIDDNTADYGTVGVGATSNCYDATLNCYQMTVVDPGPRPVPHWDATFDELLSNGSAKTWTLHMGDSFTDVPTSHQFYAGIETIFHYQITVGTGNETFSPDLDVKRSEMAVFVLKGVNGFDYAPPACTPPGIFLDVLCPGAFAVDFIEAFFNQGYSAGCNPNLYCPDDPVTRAEAVVFLVKARHGTSFVPPACTPPGTFADVLCPGAFAVDFIEQAYLDGITAGCAVAPLRFCPDNPLTRGEAAQLLVNTFLLVAYGP